MTFIVRNNLRLSEDKLAGLAPKVTIFLVTHDVSLPILDLVEN